MVVFSLFSGCGELNSLFSPGASYQVTALINGVSLDDCSIIRAGDKIRPYFASSVDNDPDLTGLLVYVQNRQGKIIGEQVLYILQPYYGDSMEAETQENFDKPGDGTDGEIEGPGEHEANREAILGFIEESTVRDQKFFINSATGVQTPVVVPIMSLNQEIPYFHMPKNMEIGPYKLVFEAMGRRETLHRMELDIFFLGSAEFSVKDISIYLPRVSDSQMIPPGTTVMLESRLDYDARLEPYVVWHNGRSVISEGKISEGAGTILWKSPERAGFYSLRLEVFPFELRGNYTGIFREIALPVSKATAANGGYFFGEGPGYAALSPLAAGTIFPELEQAKAEAALEEKEEATALPERPSLLRWYQFQGNLCDTVSGSRTEGSLEPGADKAPRWAAAGQTTYGLSTGPEDAYLLPPLAFFHGDSDQGGGIFLLHAKSLAEGIVFSAFFPMQSSGTEGATMHVLRKGNAIVLRLKTKEATVEMPAYLPFFEFQAFITVALEFYIRPYRLEAKMSLGNAGGERQTLASVEGNVRLPGPLAGEARAKLGGGEAISGEGPAATAQSPATPKAIVPAEPKRDRVDSNDNSQSADIYGNDSDFESPVGGDGAEAIPATAEQDSSTMVSAESSRQEISANTIWNEFAVLYSSLPIQEEELADADDEVDGTEIGADVTLENRSGPDLPNPAAQDAPGAMPDEPEAEESGDLASGDEEGQVPTAIPETPDETSQIGGEAESVEADTEAQMPDDTDVTVKQPQTHATLAGNS